MADNATGWRNAATDPPPEDVPVHGILADGTGGFFERNRDEAGDWVWAESARPFYDRTIPRWSADEAYYDDEYAVRYWHPLPDVPTLAELAALERAASVAATAAAKGAGR